MILLHMLEIAEDVLRRCQAMGEFSDESGAVTRTFLSAAMRSCHLYLSDWMKHLGMSVQVDAAGNLRGLYPGSCAARKRLVIGSHLDTVPDAGLYDGVLGVVWGLALVAAMRGARLPFAIEVIGFSEEEGVRFGAPFIGSRAVAGTLDEQLLQTCDSSGISVAQAMSDFGLDLSRLPEAALDPSAAAYLELHIEQGPVLESLRLPVATVDGIAGQSRAAVTFTGRPNHAGTTPMPLRRDALCAAAEWILSVEHEARLTDGLVATVGRIEARPGAGNVIPGDVRASLDVRHSDDAVCYSAFANLLAKGESIAHQRGLTFNKQIILDQRAVPMHGGLTDLIKKAIAATGITPHEITSGAGHDAMILAPRLPCGMIFVRCPGGISHHPSETVQLSDVAVALRAGLHLLQNLSQCPLLT